MVALRIRVAGVSLSVPFWFSALGAAFTPTSVGYQDLAALLARQPGVAERWREHMIASPFGTIHAATFSFSRPIGTSMPEPLGAQPVNIDPRSLDVKVWSGDEPPVTRPALQIEYPTVNRQRKGDRLPLPASSPGSADPDSLPQLRPIDAPAPPPSPPAPVAPPRLKNAEDRDAAPDAMSEAPVARTSAALKSPEAADALASRFAALDQGDNARTSDAEDDVAIADKPPDLAAIGESEPLETSSSSSLASLSFLDEDPAARDVQLYFGVVAMGSPGGLEQWAPGAAPVLASPIDPDIKLAALDGRADTGTSGETVAGKDGGLQTPADRLGLKGKPRARAEKCLADAVYFEARGEPLRGQMAVAQVVMNRVFSGYYPNDVCGVVYQNANHYLACQFTFACEGKDLSRIDELDMWEQAKRIAKDALDGKIWLREVGHATHYHAYWVHPSWVHEMKKMYQLGVHTFYRPRAWGDGSDAPVWSAVPSASKLDAPAHGPDATARGPEAALSPAAPAAAKNEPVAKL
ncbi:MAG TPA: cell wall hydrolase [Xanthobacteraceae bacterium]|nr:cell wall hydrolase [Xanthobacteraceae bacterium]